MIIFVADDHFGVHPGAEIFKNISPRFPEMEFYENDLSCFKNDKFAEDCDLLILNMIADTCDNEKAGEDVEASIKAYCESGKNLLLLHGASAAFWHWAWWRKIVGFRWVRGNDPDGVDPSTHPTHHFQVDLAKSRHELVNKLSPITMPHDEIYINLEQVCPTITLLETTIPDGTFPQCYICKTPWGGKIIGFLPGHSSGATNLPELNRNIEILVQYLLDN
jgi:Trehalose utilisation